MSCDSAEISVCDGETQTDSVVSCSQGIQLGEFPIKPYQCYETRKKSEIRAELVEKICDLLKGYVHGDKQELPNLVQDLLNSKKWSTTLGLRSAQSKEDVTAHDKVLHSILKKYKACKKKEENSAIRKQGKKLTQAINISDTLSKSTIALQGSTPDCYKSRMDAACSLGRVIAYSAERRRLLSIVANDYPRSLLTALFQCSKSTVAAARVHAILFGRGGVPTASFKFSRQCVSQEVLDQLAEFLLRDDMSRPSSSRSVVVEGQECPVRYWQDSIKEVVKQYLLEFPNGVKRSYIYAHIPKNFRSNTLLAGLCNLCEDYGFPNFDKLRELVQKIATDCQCENLSGIKKMITDLQRYLKTKFSHQVLFYFFFSQCVSFYFDGMLHNILFGVTCNVIEKS